MVERFDRAWRVCATGLCFSGFGLGGLVLRVLVFPALSLAPWSAARRQRACRHVIHHAFRLFLWLMCAVGVIRYEVRNARRLDREGLLIVANHPSLIDVVFLIALTRRADCVVKAGLARNPFTRGPVLATGYVQNDSGAAMVQGCIDSLRAGNNLVIFPEGTRTPADGSLRLQRGAANIAVRGGFALTPVVIRCEPPTLRKGDKWYQVPVRRPRYVIDVREDIDPARLAAPGADDAMAVRAVTLALTDYFSREIRRAGA
ncbi:lysophospholipid acyltransferase family protein [Cupriavidus oxalaticus]|jgi:1-acyl-sn-glycerol-3-phosphate acyltransferase|uniref:1-acyl-sn-glycerol-3-phosphate acyltransferase n=1 Tax=Cupriavidus oxalaticus TaxID=96344 RepID=A0A375GL38_9BURK|nr:lysophospholipid acyltransferase family protein [Cupriavidus oxalaticus]QEZ43994.1 1-acyl-sn-glycerol-3-phosphate acyltransferase [Cupriavidus oxalaticus]QRQ84599.1 1-acyl-sn-glycerol-3-phosphate acyltransferase [Cupriavidus oxalaticus]QRQ91312.1 1-acyl-sn-glycerol-3-phosphate acyltransferase [Cupriavidus oxalaticus]WQD85869.1 lysophospholipid acyltransferase family protein [Cupriavidus oxalaticus]SPC19931.1 Glycerol acyltransferase [Cupriavidus oxalaticus]